MWWREACCWHHCLSSGRMEVSIRRCWLRIVRVRALIWRLGRVRMSPWNGLRVEVLASVRWMVLWILRMRM